MILMTKNINLTNEELELIQGGADTRWSRSLW